MMKRIEIQIENRRDLHDLFERELPQPYGRTLDALHDTLSVYPTQIELVYSSNNLYQALGERYCENFLRMLEDTAGENPNLILTPNA